MFKFMMKTAVISSLAAGAAVAAFGPDKIVDWVRSGKEKVEEQINEFQGMSSELKALENRVDNLDDDVLELKERALKEQLEVDGLREHVKQRQKTLEHLHRNLEKAESILNTPGDRFNIQGITYTREEIERDVADKMRMYQVQQDTLAQLRQTLLTREQSLSLHNENVAKSKDLRQELVAQVQFLKAQLDRYNARQVYAEAVTMDFDAQKFNTEIGETRQMLAHFERKLKVKNRLLDDQISIDVDSTHVAGIDYDRPGQKRLQSVREELSALLRGDNKAAGKDLAQATR